MPYTDCAGDTFGSAVNDCNHVCGGSSIRGDVNVNHLANDTDVNLYLEGIKDENIPFTTCIDLNGDNQITVTDPARLNGCLRSTAGTHHHPGNTQNTHNHCEFPFNVLNPFDSITFSIADTNLAHHYIDLSVYNPTCQLLAYEFKLQGLVVDSVKNLALGNYTPNIRASSAGHVVGISTDENSLFKQPAPLNFMRVYFSALTDTQICISNIVAVLNADYEEVKGKISNGCVHIAQAQDTVINRVDFLSPESLSIIPNPSTGIFELYMDGKSLQGAELRLADAVGTTINQTKNETLSNHTTLDLTNQPTGVYFLQVTINGRSLVKRLVLVK